MTVVFVNRKNVEPELGEQYVAVVLMPCRSVIAGVNDTGALGKPPEACTTKFAGHWMVGYVVSMIASVKLQLELGPFCRIALHVTTVLGIKKRWPDDGTQSVAMSTPVV